MFAFDPECGVSLMVLLERFFHGDVVLTIGRFFLTEASLLEIFLGYYIASIGNR